MILEMLLKHSAIIVSLFYSFSILLLFHSYSFSCPVLFSYIFSSVPFLSIFSSIFLLYFFFHSVFLLFYFSSFFILVFVKYLNCANSCLEGGSVHGKAFTRCSIIDSSIKSLKNSFVCLLPSIAIFSITVHR